MLYLFCHCNLSEVRAADSDTFRFVDRETLGFLKFPGEGMVCCLYGFFQGQEHNAHVPDQTGFERSSSKEHGTFLGTGCFLRKKMKDAEAIYWNKKKWRDCSKWSVSAWIKKPKFEQMEHDKKWSFFAHFLSFISCSLPGKYSCAMIGGLEWDLFNWTLAVKFSPSHWMCIESSLEIPVL